MLIECLLSTVAAATATSTTVPPMLSPSAEGQRARDVVPPPPSNEDIDDGRPGPGQWLPKVGEGLEVEVNARFGVGTDATDAVRADPPYGAVIDFRGVASRYSWFGAVHWGVQIAGPDANEAPGRASQTFHPWEIGLDGGYRYQPTRRWHIVPQIGVRAQPEAIGPSTNSDIGAQVELLAQRDFGRQRRGLSASVRVVGRYGPGDHDRVSDRRLRRSTCFLWGRRFFDCALAFTVAPGSVGAEGAVDGRLGRFTATLWGGWFLAGRADESGEVTGPTVPVPQEDGDWSWLGLRVSAALADDIDAAVAMLTGGRWRDAFGTDRAPFFASDLARTTVVVHVTARL